jgi:hypothetical protein
MELTEVVKALLLNTAKDLRGSYDLFAKFYDAVMGEPTASVTLLETLIQELHPETKSVLIHTENHLYNWRLQIFEQVGNDLYHRQEANILETSFPIPQIERAAREFFEIKRLFDPRNTEVLPTSQRVYFVCQKRG